MEHIFFFSFLWPHPHTEEVPTLGVESELQLPAYATATATGDLSHLCDYTRAHGNTGPLTYWVGPGIKLVSSWILGGFVSAAPQCKFLEHNFYQKKKKRLTRNLKLWMVHLVVFGEGFFFYRNHFHFPKAWVVSLNWQIGIKTSLQHMCISRNQLTYSDLILNLCKSQKWMVNNNGEQYWDHSDKDQTTSLCQRAWNSLTFKVKYFWM